jgi:hypothetical protein
MTQTSNAGVGLEPKGFGEGYLFGVPLGRLGWFAMLLMGTAAGFVAFFGGTFLGIVGIMVWNGSEHANVDYSLSYRAVGLPLGVVVLVLAYAVLGAMWVRRMGRKT